MLIRFDNAAGRGPSGQLWTGLVDWTKGIDTIDNGAVHLNDHTPFLGDDVGRISTGDGAVLQTDEPYGVVNYDEAQGVDEMVGFSLDYYVDLDRTGFKEFAIETRIKSNDDSATTQSFVGLTDVDINAFFGADNTPDGSSLGVRWNADETFDLVSISSSDVITVLSDAFATVARTEGFIKIGFRVKNLDGTNYLVRATVTTGTGTSAITYHTKATTATVPGAPMFPAVLHTNDNQAAPDMEEDWTAFVELE